MDDPRLRALSLEPVRLLFRLFVTGVLPFWVVLTALCYEWGAAPAPSDPGLDAGAGSFDAALRLGAALGRSTSMIVVVLLLVVPIVVLATALRRTATSTPMDAEDLDLLAGELSGAPVRVTVTKGVVAGAASPRPRVPVQAPDVRDEALPVAVAPVKAPVAPEPSAAASSGDDDVDQLFR